MKNPTSRADFKIFKHQVALMVEKFGLKEYELDFNHQYISGALADFEVTEGVLAHFTLSKDWHERKVTEAALKETATHEVLHLLLYRLLLLSGDRFVTQAELNRAEHDIVYRLEKLT